MKLITTTAIAGILLATTACYTPIKVHLQEKRVPGQQNPSPWLAASESDKSKKVDGVPFFLPKLDTQEYKLTKLEKPDGTVTLECENVFFTETVAVPDYDNLYVIEMHDFFFGSNKFGVTYDKYMLASVTSERDPQVDEMINAVAGAAKTVAAFGAPAVETKDTKKILQDCNAGKRAVPKKPVPKKRDEAKAD